MSEKYTPPEATQEFEASSQSEEKKVEKSFWKKITSAKEAAVFASLLSVLSSESAFAADTKTRKTAQVEQKDKKAEVGKDIERIKTLLQEKGQKGKMTGGAVAGGEIVLRKLISENGDKIEAGYDEHGKVLWLTEEDVNSQWLYLDNDCDGSVDRVVMNDDQKKNASLKSMENTLKAFSSKKTLITESNLVAALIREPVKVFDLHSGEKGEVSMTAIDFEVGGGSVLEGEKAKKLYEAVQGLYAGKLHGFDVK